MLLCHEDSMSQRSCVKSALAIALAAGSLWASVPAMAADVITVVLDQAKIINLPEGANTIIIGNPIVADATMLRRNNQMILTGKGFGETNLIALDSSGAAVGESVIRVVSPTNDLVVQRGMDRESYSCMPRCQPTVRLGDAQKYMSEVGSAIQQRNQMSLPGGGGPPTK